MRRNKKRETTILLVLASVTAFLLCIGCISARTGYLFKNKTHLKNTPVVLSTNWKIDGKTVTLPFSTKGVNEVVITHTVTADEAEKTILLVEHNHQNMMVVLDGKVIYQLGAVNDRRASSMYGSVAIEVNLKEGSELGIMYFGLLKLILL
ncbi:MAG: hypothetical protein HUJ58_02285, partial [Erysipelotrichaceae bacterium]|nr:hypothetical protein [Erysipelotrichaceae bacterium]